MVEKHYKDKAALVAELHDKLSSASTVIVTEYRGLKATDMVKLRTALRPSQIEVTVVKNSLLRRAAQGTPSEALVGELSGPIAVAIGFGEPAEAAKALSDGAKSFEKFNVQKGLVEKMLVTDEQLVAIGKLPGKEAMRAQAVGALQGPLAGLVFTLQGVMTAFAGTLQAKIEKESA